jgi:hypothetical protein
VTGGDDLGERQRAPAVATRAVSGELMAVFE